MSLDYDLLRTLHHKLRMITDLDERIKKGPRKVKVVVANEANFLTALEEAKERLTELRKASNAKQMQLAEREAKIEDMKGKLNVCDSNKEFQLLKDRIAADEQANSVLQDEILEQLERLDVLTEESDAAKKNYEQSQVDTKTMKAEVEADIAALESEKARVKAELAEAEKSIPNDLMIQYQRLVKAKGDTALGVTDTYTCGNCNQTLTPQTVNELMMNMPVFCKGCDCLMYLPEGFVRA